MKEESATIEEVIFDDAIGERYLAYALSTIMSRSLPDVRDGLKPVHRRILFAMMQLKLDPKSGFKKCARVVGDVIGKYHPHGDVAVYETLVRLAQDFTVRYPLIEGQGNFGSVDGDNAAAMRYTESRLTEIALALLKDIDKDTVNFRPTYDAQEEEPTLLPASFPNILANGAEGIAVGMATSVAPHNLEEICDATLRLLKKKSTTIEELLEHIQGPDFPTGGVIIESKESILQTYKTGRGSFRTRGKWHKEELNHGLYQLIITEIPYQVQKSRLIMKIADLFREKKLALLGNIRDESSEDIRIVLEPRNRTCDPEMLMESLFKLTDLENKYSLNMNILDKNSIPKVMNLKEVLEAFLEHRDLIVLKRAQFTLDKTKRRMEVLEGFIICYLNLDEIIRIIRFEDQPKSMIIEAFKLTENQAEAILNMRLRSLRKLEEVEIKKEHDELKILKADLEETVKDELKRKKIISEEIKEIKKKFGKSTKIGARRSSFVDSIPDVKPLSIEALVEREAITIICSSKGWIRAIKGHNNDPKDAKYKDGDEGRFFLKAYTTDKLLIFSSAGKFFTLRCDTIPRGKGHGDSLNVLVDLEASEGIINVFTHNSERKLLVASSKGKGFVVAEKDVVAQTKNGKKILNLGAEDKAIACKYVNGDSVAVIGNNRKLLVFNISELPEMKKGSGVIMQKYKDGTLSDVLTFKSEEGLSWKLGEQRTRNEQNLINWLGKRGSAGKMPPVGFPKNNKFGF